MLLYRFSAGLHIREFQRESRPVPHSLQCTNFRCRLRQAGLRHLVTGKATVALSRNRPAAARQRPHGRVKEAAALSAFNHYISPFLNGVSCGLREEIRFTFLLNLTIGSLYMGHSSRQCRPDSGRMCLCREKSLYSLGHWLWCTPGNQHILRFESRGFTGWCGQQSPDPSSGQPCCIRTRGICRHAGRSDYTTGFTPGRHPAVRQRQDPVHSPVVQLCTLPYIKTGFGSSFRAWAADYQ